MELDDTRYVAVNVPSNFQRPEDVSEYFSLQAPPNTNIWRGSSTTSDNTTAPMIIRRLRQSFILAEVTVSAEFEMEFDQAGLVIFVGEPPSYRLRQSPPSSRHGRANSTHNPGTLPTGKWVKAGLEFSGGKIHVASVVASSSCGSDWCSSATLSMPSSFESYSAFDHCLRVKFERVNDSLWIWYKIMNAQVGATACQPQNVSSSSINSSPEMELRTPSSVSAEWKKMREVMGFFGTRSEKNHIWVGCYAGRPMNYEPSNSWEEVDQFNAEFEDLDIL